VGCGLRIQIKALFYLKFLKERSEIYDDPGNEMSSAQDIMGVGIMHSRETS
jgi:hypothetical protein